MNHLTEEQLVLHYYGEGDDPVPAEAHLENCEPCRAVYESLQHTFRTVDATAVPERGPEYGDQVWRRIEPHLPARRQWSAPWRWSAAAAVFASLLVSAFLAGRFFPWTPRPQPTASDGQARERILRVAVEDYLERSQLVLIELANASPREVLDISVEQERAAGLVTENRLYRQTAANAGDAAMEGVLEELERALLEIRHAPSRLSPRDLEQLRDRLESEGILFKIRVLGRNVRQL